MKRFVVLNKKVGETPLTAVTLWKQRHPTYADVPVSYAGRLDPMASGKLLVLIGDECKKQTAYTGLDKEYVIEVLFGVGSDTGDALGIVSSSAQAVTKDALQKALVAECGAHERAYPIFSSKTVNGKPLFLHALEGTIDTIRIPTHQEHIYTIKQKKFETIEAKTLQSRVASYLVKVPTTQEPSKMRGADFRIAEVRASWQKVFAHPQPSYVVVTLRVACGTGTYMRSLAPRLAQALGTKGLLLSISRTRIGKYWHGFWVKSY